MELSAAIELTALRQAGVKRLQHQLITVRRRHDDDSAEVAAVRRELAAGRLALAILAARGLGLSEDDVVSVAASGSLPDPAHPARILADPDWLLAREMLRCREPVPS
jgi:hypothetical protein